MHSSTTSSEPASDPRVPGPLSAPAATPLEEVDGWQLLSLLGRGELTEVFEARPAGAPAEAPAGYVLKRLRADRAHDRAAQAYLCQEASLGRRLSHAHLVPVLACRVQEEPRYLVMPRLEGQTWSRRLAAGIRPDLPEALWHIRQTAEALAYLHAQGWRHGDVKPANLLVSPAGHVTLLDLGLARPEQETSSVFDHAVTGTLEYLAPESITSRLRADRRSDLYSLGVTFFELLTGRRPFQAQNLAELAQAQRQQPVPDLRALAPEIPSSVARLVERLLAKDPLRRPGSASELMGELVSLEIEHFTARNWHQAWAEEIAPAGAN